MKNYRQLIKELPSKSVTIAFGNFNIPTAKHESYIKVSKKIAESNSTDHIVYVSDDKNILAERKDHYLNLLFPHTKFVHSEATIPYIVETLSKKYKSITIVISEDKRQVYSRHIRGFNNVSLVSIAENDVDSEASKIKSFVTKGQYQLFKESLPSQVRDIDGKLLMNELRHGLGLETIKEQVKFNVDEIREQYFQGKIFQVDDIVESNDEVLKIVKRGSNHILLERVDGSKVSKWIQDIKPTEKEFVKLEESIDSRVTIDPKSGYNGAKDVLRYSDFKKLLKMNKGEVKEETTDECTRSTDLLPNAQKERIVDIENTGSWANEVGHSLGHGDDSQLRRRKAIYHREEVETVEEDAYTSEYKVKKWIGQDGQEHSRKIRPHRIDFKNSKFDARPSQQDSDDVREAADKEEFKKKYPIKADALGGGARNKGFDAFYKEELEKEQTNQK